MQKNTPLLLAGAGPFGLSLAAYLKHEKIEHIHVGASMDYWKNFMPLKMFLRSACDWHLDPHNEATIVNYLKTLNLQPADVEPLSLDFYLTYIEWFQRQKGISPLPAWITKIDQAGNGFDVTFADGSSTLAEKLVMAVGLRYFKNIPEPLNSLFPSGRFHHTAEYIDFSNLKGKRVLIVGGRQSAFEWAALIHEEGAQNIHMTYRHDTPAFTPSDWTWVNPLVESMADRPEWFRNLAQEEKDAIIKRMWGEGRLKLEPWLAKRITQETIHLHPQTQVANCKELPAGELQITLNDGSTFPIDHVILATGYKMDIAQIPMLANGTLAAKIKTQNGFPVLDESFQSSVPNLYFTGLPAAQDFGPFFGFTAAANTSARIIGRALSMKQNS